ncbi:MAG TPA: hypothetical protein VG370_34785 [Chloroflexota bacterium]|nr:hypothetical protein [Chloroflexota bacterium]
MSAEARAERCEKVIGVLRGYIEMGESRPSAVSFAARYNAWGDLRAALRQYDAALADVPPNQKGPTDA